MHIRVSPLCRVTVAGLRWVTVTVHLTLVHNMELAMERRWPDWRALLCPAFPTMSRSGGMGGNRPSYATMIMRFTAICCARMLRPAALRCGAGSSCPIMFISFLCRKRRTACAPAYPKFIAPMRAIFTCARSAPGCAASLIPRINGVLALARALWLCGDGRRADRHHARPGPRRGFFSAAACGGRRATLDGVTQGRDRGKAIGGRCLHGVDTGSGRARCQAGQARACKEG